MARESSGSVGEKSYRPSRRRFNLDWELLLWMFASFATLYFTNFASNLLFNDKINRYVCSLMNLVFKIGIY